MNKIFAPVTIQSADQNLSQLTSLFMISSGTDDEAAIRQIIRLEKMRGTHYLVAELAGEVIGFIGYWYNADDNDVEPPQIIDLAVLPEYQHQGIGSALLEKACNQLQEAGSCTVWMQINSNQVDELAFFQNSGFEMVSLIADWCGVGQSKAIFKRNL